MTRNILKAVLILAVCLSGGNMSWALEEPDYTVLKKYDAFELRQYDAALVAEIKVVGSFDDVGDQAFPKLFKFISKDDRPQGEIAMTVPVVQQDITSNLLSSDKGTENNSETGKRPSAYRFAFFMPVQYTIDNLPEPQDADIQIREIASKTMAVRRYSGTWSENRYRKNEKILLDALREEGLEAVGTSVFARYNAPFSLWFLRRNEVMIEIRMP